MENSRSKKVSLLKMALYFLGYLVMPFTFGVFIYSWDKMIVFWPPEYPGGRSMLWGFSFGGLVGLAMLGLAQLLYSVGKKRTERLHKKTGSKM